MALKNISRENGLRQPGFSKKFVPPFPACPKVAEKQTHSALSQEVNRMYQEIGYSQFQLENAVLIELSTSIDAE